MEAPSFDLIEEFHSEDSIGPPNRSINHSKRIHRISVAPDRYEGQYDILPELALPTGKCKPDVAIYESLSTNWFNDLIFYNQPPLTAVEVLSPKQGLSDLTDKAFTIYFPAGVKTVWLVVLMLPICQILLPDGTQLTWPNSILKDPVTQLELDVDHLLR